MLKILGWIVGIIFLIGLLVVLGVFDLIFWAWTWYRAAVSRAWARSSFAARSHRARVGYGAEGSAPCHFPVATPP